MKSKTALHAYTTEEDNRIIDNMVTSLGEIGRTKARAGDVITAILVTAARDDRFLAEVRKELYGGNHGN